MSIHTISGNTPINEPRLRRAIQMIYKIAGLSAHKAALHHKDPRRFPLEPHARCFEQLFLEHIRELPPEKQRRKVASAAAVADAPAEQRARSLGALGGVNLNSPVPISEQVFGSARARAVVTDASRIADDGEIPRRGPGGIDRLPLKGGGTGRLPVKRLVFRVHRVKCIKETGEWGKDEIDMGAAAVNVTSMGGAAQVSKEMLVEPFRVGSFHSGNESRLGDRILYPFYPPAEDKFPAMWIVALLLVERDKGKTATIRKRLRSIQEQLVTEAHKVANLSGVRDEGDPVFKSFLGILLFVTLLWIVHMFVDEFFNPAVVGLIVDSPNSELLQEGHETPRESVTVVRTQGEGDDTSEDGKYEITYSWAVVK